jgi:hypothetical protein
MNPTPRPVLIRRSPRRPRGSAYLLVLGASTILLVVGLSVSAIARAQVRATGSASRASASAAASQSAIEYVAKFMAVYTDWRNAFGNSGAINGLTIGFCTANIAILDEIDGLIWNDDTHPVRVFATAGTVDAQRICSQVFVPDKRIPWKALSCAVLADKAITINASARLTVVNGLIASNTSISSILLSQTNGDMAAPAVLALGSTSGSIANGVANTPLPGSNAFDTLNAIATVIPYGSIGGDKIDNCVLSPNSNPFGSTNAQGVYRIDVPATKKFEIKRARIDATLLVVLGSGAEVALKEKLSWDARANGLALLVKADPASSSITLQSGPESIVDEDDIKKNLNPVGSPYLGVSDNDQADTYPVGVRGMIYTTGRGSVSVKDNFFLSGCLISESSISFAGDIAIYANPMLAGSPPLGFEGAMLMKPQPGSFRWETEATRDQVIANSVALAGPTTPPTGRTTTAPANLIAVIIEGLGIK